MSFSSEVKEELGKRLDTARHCQIAEFAAIMAFCGKMRSDSGEEMQIEVRRKMKSFCRNSSCWQKAFLKWKNTIL